MVLAKGFWENGPIRGQGGYRNPHGGGGSFGDEPQRIVRIFTGRHGVEKREGGAGRRGACDLGKGDSVENNLVDRIIGLFLFCFVLMSC